jgi:hypothetical protein
MPTNGLFSIVSFALDTGLGLPIDLFLSNACNTFARMHVLQARDETQSELVTQSSGLASLLLRPVPSDPSLQSSASTSSNADARRSTSATVLYR